MNQPKFYPEFNPALKTTLNTWKKLIESDSEYLDNELCPYTPEEVELLTIMFGSQSQNLSEDPNNGTGIAAIDLATDEIPDFETEALSLYRDMKIFKGKLSSSDTSEMTSTFRTMVSLMEKILDVQERASGIKQFGVFKNFILDSMERYLSPTQKAEFVEEMKFKLNQE